MADCRSCGAPVLWATTEQGRRIPLDRDPVEAGKFRLRPRGDGSLTAVSITEEDPGHGHQQYDTHFATCSNAGRHRRST